MSNDIALKTVDFLMYSFYKYIQIHNMLYNVKKQEHAYRMQESVFRAGKSIDLTKFMGFFR